jgi:hypothetical protein
MKEDILEQLVDGWFLRQKGTFTKHNVKYRPHLDDISHLNARERSLFAVSSDIDVMAVHLDKNGSDRVSVVSCKSWQNGFDVDFFYNNLNGTGAPNARVGTGPAWKKFRELFDPCWAKAFRDKIFQETQSHSFTYFISITKFKGRNPKHVEGFKNCQVFLNNLSDNGKYEVKIEFLTLEHMIHEILSQDSNTTLESTEIGRFMQLIKAADLKFVKK